MRCCGINKSDQGAALILTLSFIASLSFLVYASVGSSLSSSRYMHVVEDKQADEHIKDSIVGRAMLAIKNYAWTSGNSIDDLLPATHSNDYANRFALYQTSVYENITYRTYIGDNSDETGNQDFSDDTDNKIYVKVAMDFPTGTRAVQVLMTPGSPQAGSSSAVASLESAVGVCYDSGFNGTTFASLGPKAKVNGTDITPKGLDSCKRKGGCETGASWYGMSSTAQNGFSFSLGGLDPCVTTFTATLCWNETLQPHAASVTGKRYQEWHNDPAQSYGMPSTKDCQAYSSMLNAVENMKTANDSRLQHFEKEDGVKEITGNRTYGTRNDPDVVLIETGMLGMVEFKGKLKGVGILVIDGNVTFKKKVQWEGIVIKEAKNLWSHGHFQKLLKVNGAVLINQALQSTGIGVYSTDLSLTKYNAKHVIQYSSKAIDNVLKGGKTGNALDPNYNNNVPASQKLAVFATQEL